MKLQLRVAMKRHASLVLLDKVTYGRCTSVVQQSQHILLELSVKAMICNSVGEIQTCEMMFTADRTVTSVCPAFLSATTSASVAGQRCCSTDSYMLVTAFSTLMQALLDPASMQHPPHRWVFQNMSKRCACLVIVQCHMLHLWLKQLNCMIVT